MCDAVRGSDGVFPAAPRDPRRRPCASVYRGAGTNHLALIWIMIACHTLVWTLATTVLRWPGAMWEDMLEAYIWAQQWQLGYYKHPPLYAWIVGLWFKVFPRADWAFYLLSFVNIGVGLFGIWRLAGFLVKPQAQLLSALCSGLNL